MQPTFLDILGENAMEGWQFLQTSRRSTAPCEARKKLRSRNFPPTGGAFFGENVGMAMDDWYGKYR